MDSTDPDLSRFATRGGKLILKEQMSDHALSPFAGVAYYKSVLETRSGSSSIPPPAKSRLLHREAK
jgi:hypothetical protein